MALRIKPDNYKAPEPPAQEEEPVEETQEAPIEEPTADIPVEDPMQPMGGNVDPTVARYLGPESRCQSCIHYLDPGSCEILAGPIDPQGVCSLFTPDASEALIDPNAPLSPETDNGIANLPPDNA